MTKNIRAPPSWTMVTAVSCKEKSRPLSIKSNLSDIHRIQMHTTYVDTPGRLQRCTCPNRRASLTTGRLYWDMVSPHLFPHSASPQICIWNIWWPSLRNGHRRECTLSIFWTCDIKNSSSLSSTFIFIKKKGNVKEVAEEFCEKVQSCTREKWRDTAGFPSGRR